MIDVDSNQKLIDHIEMMVKNAPRPETADTKFEGQLRIAYRNGLGEALRVIKLHKRQEGERDGRL